MKAPRLAVCVVGFAVLVLIGGCRTVALHVPVLRPAEINMAKYKQVAVAEIGGNNGRAMADKLNEALVESGRFSVVDRQNLDRIIKEQGLSASDLTDPNTAAKLGKVMAASAMIFGTGEKDYKETMKKESGTCTKYEGKKATKYACTTYTRIGSIKVKGTLKVVDVETGQILKTKTLPCEKNVATSKTDGDPDRIDPEPIQEACVGMIVSMFMKAIAPYKEIVEAKFVKDGDMPSMEQGINQAKLGDWTNAVETFKAAVDSGAKNPKTSQSTLAKGWWNLGLALEYSGQFDEALKALKKAYELNPDDECLNEVKNVEKRKAEQKKLQEQEATGGSQ
ncbi:MAG: tetratricopeptide repeat protein [Deltaproteobacteria bacterium]|nr:tetratricopeptide repeat protein [Deltaproteobacteria bacterium]